MDNIYNNLYNLFLEELNDLEIGYPYNKTRLSYMRSIIAVILYLRYTILDDKDILKILQYYEHI